MSWNYSGDPTVSAKDAVRFWVGDTNPDDQLVQDEEIAYVLSVDSDPKGAAAAICDALAAKFSASVDLRLGDYSVSLSQKAEAFAARAKQLKQLNMLNQRPIPYAGGISISDKRTQKQNQDRVQPAFKKGMSDSDSERKSVGSW